MGCGQMVEEADLVKACLLVLCVSQRHDEAVPGEEHIRLDLSPKRTEEEDGYSDG